MKSVIVLSLLVAICYADVGFRGYAADNSGQYVHDNSGQYIPDYSGNYIHDGLGKYSDNIAKYRHQEDKYQGAGTYVRPVIQTTTINPIPKINYASLYNAGKEGQWRILRQKTNIGPEVYHYEYETENKIQAEETGKLVNKGSKNEGVAADGFYEYVGPDNVKYHVVYTAGEQGFQPVGAHIPTPPPIPEAIARALQLKSSGRL